MLLYIMGDSNTKQAGDSNTKPLDQIIVSGSVNFKEVQEGLDDAGMNTLNIVLSNCRNAIETAHSNAKEAFKYQQEVERFLEKNTVKKKDNKSVDYEKSNPKVNFKALQGGMYYVGNRYNWMNFASEYVGKWTKNSNWGEVSDYIFEGKHTIVGDDLKDSGVETFKNGDKFYGKFAGTSRTSGVYTWSNTSLYIGNIQNENVNGFGGLMQTTPESTEDKRVYEFIFGEFDKRTLPTSYISKIGDKIYWVSNKTPTILSNDQASQVSYYLNKVTENFKQLGIWTEGLHKLEDKTGLNRTGLYAIAALGLAGVGFWAYKKFRKSITQKNKVLSKSEKAAITRAKNKALKDAAASGSVMESKSASGMEENSGSGMESNVSSAAGTVKNKSAAAKGAATRKNKSALRKAAAAKGAATRAANKAANVKVEGSNVKVEGSNVKVEGSNAVWSSPAESKEAESKEAESKEAESKVEVGLRRSQRIRANKSKENYVPF